MDNNTINNIVKECGVTLYDTEIVSEGGRKIFRVFILGDGGVSLDKCSEVSRILSPLFDLTPPVDGEYILEVSSPGIERKLTKLFHYQNSINELVKIKHSELGKLKGRILSVNKDSFTIKNKENKEELELNYADIITAKTYYPW